MKNVDAITSLWQNIASLQPLASEANFNSIQFNSKNAFFLLLLLLVSRMKIYL